MANLEFSNYVETRDDAGGTLDGNEILYASKDGQSVRFTTQQLIDELSNPSSGGVQSVSGAGVDNTDPANPVISFPDPSDIGLGNVDNVHTIGVQDVNIPSAAMWPRGTDGCAPLTNYSMPTAVVDAKSNFAFE